LQLLTLIGADNVMGVAIGNEMDLLWQNGASPDCLTNLWANGYVTKKFDARVSDLDKLGAAWKQVKVTQPFSEYIFAGKTTPFVETPQAMINTFVTSVLKTHGSRWVFSLNNYPYFDTGNALDSPGSNQCKKSIAQSTCFDKPTCLFSAAVITMRMRMKMAAADASALWITETGWSSPKADNLQWDPTAGKNYQMANCPEFSEASTFQAYYDNFLKWDLTIPGAPKGADHVFFFSMRDSSNFGVAEHFGLGAGGDPQKLCTYTACKLQSGNMEEAELVV